MKMPNGYGSAYKLPGNRRRPWIARKTIGWDENGKQLYYTIGYFKDHPAALAALVAYNKTPIGERRDITLGGLYEEWSESRFSKIADQTVNSYSAAWKHLSILKEEKFRDIKKTHIQSIIDKMTGDGFSFSSVHKVKVLTSLLYKHALADDIVDKNYAELVEMPENNSGEKEIFNDLEIKAMEKLAKTDIWIGTILILIYSGMRIGEMLAHTKFTVDIKNLIMTGGNKTEAGKKKVIPIHSKIKEYVEYWYNQEGSYLISRNGQKISVNYYRKYLYYPALKKAKIRSLSPHSTRHTFASLLNRAGVDKTYQQKLIGHANYSTTANIYTHPEVAELRNAIEMI